LLLILCFVTAFSSTMAGIPPAVVTAFYEKYPAADSVRWGKINCCDYEAEFVLDAKKLTALYNTEGMWQETAIKISLKDLPAAVSKGFNKEFGSKKISAAYSLEMIGEKKLFYKIEFRKGLNFTDAVFSSEGKLEE